LGREARTRSGLGFDCGGLLDRPLGTAYASCFAFELPQIIELGAANATLLENFNRTDHGRVDGEDALDANAKADASNRKSCAGKLSTLAHYDAFERLYAFFLALCFSQPDVHAHGIAGAESRDILANLVPLDLLKYATHDGFTRADPLVYVREKAPYRRRFSR
jgi:hypothetical protein